MARLELIDAETGAHIELSVDKCTQALHRGVRRIFPTAANGANRSGGRYVGIPTTRRLEEAIFDSLMRVGGIQ